MQLSKKKTVKLIYKHDAWFNNFILFSKAWGLKKLPKVFQHDLDILKDNNECVPNSTDWQTEDEWKLFLMRKLLHIETFQSSRKVIEKCCRILRHLIYSSFDSSVLLFFFCYFWWNCHMNSLNSIKPFLIVLFLIVIQDPDSCSEQKHENMVWLL